jgi:hypothetical protein
MVAIVSNRIWIGEERNSSDGPPPQAGWWQKAWHAFVEWLTEPVSFPGKWPACNASEERYNRDREALIPSSKKSLADVQ